MTTVSVVVVGYGDEPDLPDCLDAIRADLSEGDDVVLVDNGLTAPPDLPDVRVVPAAHNVGFAAGCHLGVAATTGEVLVFVNSDAVLQRGSLDALRTEATRAGAGLVTGLVVLADRPEVVNAAGNPVHFLGISWAGGYGEDVSLHQRTREVASVSGALFAVRRRVWSQLGGLDPDYFLYHEDADLSLRCRLAGLDVVYCPEAVAHHRYSFTKNPEKMYLLERNRLVTVLTTFPTPLLLRVVPALLLTEPLLLAMALTQGWAGAKLRSWTWLVTHASTLVTRRRRLQGRDGDWRAFAARLDPTIKQDVTSDPAAMGWLNILLGSYWSLVTARSRRSVDDERAALNGGTGR